MEFSKDCIPKNIYEKDDLNINTAGVMVFTILIFQSMALPTYLNKISPQLNVLKVLAYTGIIIFTVIAIYRLVLFNLIYGYDLRSDFLVNLKTCIVLCILGMLMAWVRIRKLRQKAIWIPIAIFLCIWMLIALFVTNES